MKLVIPATTLEVGRIHLSPFEESTHGGHPIAPLSYMDPFFKMKNIEILTPPLVIEEYDVFAGKIRFKAPISSKSPVGIFATKINTIHEYIISTLHMHQDSVLGRTDLTRDAIDSCFQRLCDGTYLNLFIAQHDTRTPVFQHDEDKPSFGLSKVFDTSSIGRSARILLRIGGIRVLPGNPYRFRIHHTIVGVYLIK